MKDGGQAFPVSNDANESGMTLRDYFAAKAMQGLLAADGNGDQRWIDPKSAVETAYEIADAMLAEREKQ